MGHIFIGSRVSQLLSYFRAARKQKKRRAQFGTSAKLYFWLTGEHFCLFGIYNTGNLTRSASAGRETEPNRTRSSKPSLESHL